MVAALTTMSRPPNNPSVFAMPRPHLVTLGICPPQDDSQWRGQCTWYPPQWQLARQALPSELPPDCARLGLAHSEVSVKVIIPATDSSRLHTYLPLARP